MPAGQPGQQQPPRHRQPGRLSRSGARPRAQGSRTCRPTPSPPRTPAPQIQVNSAQSARASHCPSLPCSSCGRTALIARSHRISRPSFSPCARAAVARSRHELGHDTARHATVHATVRLALARARAQSSFSASDRPTVPDCGSSSSSCGRAAAFETRGNQHRGRARVFAGRGEQVAAGAHRERSRRRAGPGQPWRLCARRRGLTLLPALAFLPPGLALRRHSLAAGPAEEWLPPHRHY